ncbi:Uncharacterised protein [Mycobacteroides abscessus]|nr:Uncharacterised protein [Mycobacteroides abscessus]
MASSVSGRRTTDWAACVSTSRRASRTSSASPGATGTTSAPRFG